jgi:2,4-diketo-3-deoxy-L-fuconate hydrolase
MRLVTVRDHGQKLGGVLTSDGSVAALQRWGWHSVPELIRAGPAAWEKVDQECAHAAPDWPAGQELHAPLPELPRNMFCIGVNYLSHYSEGDREGVPMAEHPVIFSKPVTTLAGPRDDIVVDRSATQQPDWEAELAVIIGTAGVNISESAAASHIFGYCLANDVSARDLQRANGPWSQWLKGKSLDGFCPLGPFIAAGKDKPALHRLRIVLAVDGEIKQDFRPADMYHPIPKLISYLSRGMKLLPGDLILTGTAAGVGFWHDPPTYLAAGNVVQITCEGLGELSNKVMDR